MGGLLHQVASVWTMMLFRRISRFCCSFPCPSQKNKRLCGFVRLSSSSTSTSVMHKYYVQLTPFRGVKVHLSQRSKRGQLTTERDNRIKECRMVQAQSGCKFVKERKKSCSCSRQNIQLLTLNKSWHRAALRHQSGRLSPHFFDHHDQRLRQTDGE
jgi:hypothetical protein